MAERRTQRGVPGRWRVLGGLLVALAIVSSSAVAAGGPRVSVTAPAFSTIAETGGGAAGIAIGESGATIRAGPDAQTSSAQEPGAQESGAAPAAVPPALPTGVPTALPPEASTAAAPPGGAGRPAPGAAYAWPLSPAPAVLSPFRAPDHAFGPGHRGVDLAGTAGQAVIAARSGTVVFAGPVAGRGVVSVEHVAGLRTTYEPLRPAVRVGTRVEVGALLGALEAGHRGCAQACLHWGVRRDRLDYLDPLVLLRPPRVRLLPVPQPWPGADAGR